MDAAPNCQGAAAKCDLRWEGYWKWKYQRQRSPSERVGGCNSWLSLSDYSQILSPWKVCRCSQTSRSGRCLVWRRPLGRQGPCSDIFMAFSLWQDGPRFCFSPDLPGMMILAATSPFWMPTWHIPNHFVPPRRVPLISILSAFVRRCQTLITWIGSAEKGRRTEEAEVSLRARRRRRGSCWGIPTSHPRRRSNSDQRGWRMGAVTMSQLGGGSGGVGGGGWRG